jgi:hypothetical protein
MLAATNIGSVTLLEWQEFVASCACPGPEHGEPGCQVHATIQACHDYCYQIDTDWLKIADWYRPGSAPRRGVTGAVLYGNLLRWNPR